MNIPTLHTFVMSQFREIQEKADPIFDAAKTRSENGKKINVKTLIRHFSQTLKPTRVSVTIDIENGFKGTGPSNQWYPPMSGCCYEPTNGSRKMAKIELILGIHSSSSRFEFTSEGWEYFRYRFYKTLLHELVHRAQFAYGRHRQSSLVFRPHTYALDKYHRIEQQYLGEIDEVEAYAHDCVEEWYCSFPTKLLTIRDIKESFRNSRQFPSLNYYYDVFQGDETHPAVQRLFRKIKAWNEVMMPLVEYLPYFQMSALNSPKNKGLGFVLD